MRAIPYMRTQWLVLTLALVFQAGTASARSQRDLAYRTDIAWNTALRLLRVDLGFQLVERDQDARFVLFRYVDGEESHPGSLEIVERVFEDGRTGVRVIISVPALPSYVELHMIDRLERKLLTEVGPPLPVPPRQSRQSPSRDDNQENDDDDDDENAREEDDDEDERDEREND